MALLGGVYLYWFWNHPLDPGEGTYLIKPGTGLKAFAGELKRRGVVPESQSFVWSAYIAGHSRDLKAGEYRFLKGLTASELLDQVVSGRTIEYPLTLLEGWTFRQFLTVLDSAPKLEHKLTGLPPGEIMARLGHPGVHPEGRFYPDTYYYSAGHSDLSILTRAFDAMQRRLEQEWNRRAPDLPLKDMNQALTLASIVEKETGRGEERKLIAGVFVNRLRRGMRLQTDPTVIYGMGSAFDGNIRLKDLKQDTPYNTYMRAGLPPTPIAMPGGESLAAALRPAETDALYFVSRGDGSHVFSATLEAHNAAVIKYQRGGRAPPATPKK